jgi:hypothetical protein
MVDRVPHAGRDKPAFVGLRRGKTDPGFPGSAVAEASTFSHMRDTEDGMADKLEDGHLFFDIGTNLVPGNEVARDVKHWAGVEWLEPGHFALVAPTWESVLRILGHRFALICG